MYVLSHSLTDAYGVGRIIENNYIIIVNFLVFHLFQFSNYLLFNKSISSIASSVYEITAEERTNETNTYNSLKLENYPPSTVSGLHFAILHLF